MGDTRVGDCEACGFSRRLTKRSGRWLCGCCGADVDVTVTLTLEEMQALYQAGEPGETCAEIVRRLVLAGVKKPEAPPRHCTECGGKGYTVDNSDGPNFPRFDDCSQGCEPKAKP